MAQRARVGPGVPTARGMDCWSDTTVPFATPNVEGMVDELAQYLELAVCVLPWLPPAQRVVLGIEPDWDGCDGRWLNIELGRDQWKASICAVALLTPDRMIDKGISLVRSVPLLHAMGWILDEHSTPGDRWGFWRTPLAPEARQAAETAFTPALALFAVYDPARWFVSMAITDAAGADIDLRAWRQQEGLAPPPPTIAPRGTEPWAILCEAGFHDQHEPPCWEGRPADE